MSNILYILSTILSLALSIIGVVLGLITRNLQNDSVMAQIVGYSLISEFINFLKLIAYITTPILICLIIWVLLKSKQLSKTTIETASKETSGVSPAPSTGGALTARWQEVVNHIGSTQEGEWKFAIIEADKLVDDILGSAGFPGETMGERLMNIEKGQLQTLDSLWDAHKIRNRLVHDTNYFLRYNEVKRAVQLYEETLRELGAL